MYEEEASFSPKVKKIIPEAYIPEPEKALI